MWVCIIEIKICDCKNVENEVIIILIIIIMIVIVLMIMNFEVWKMFWRCGNKLDYFEKWMVFEIWFVRYY